MSKRVQVGDIAPDFTLPDQNGNQINLKKCLKGKAVVLFFYPKDFTAACTKQACSFRDNYQLFEKLGAEVLGISSDSLSTHQQFADKYNLPFSILSDKGNEVRKRYGVVSSLGFLIARRVTYVIDKEGIVRYIFSSQFRLKAHIDEALGILRKIQ